MSIHRSLVMKGKLKRHRNVLKRSERIQRMQEEEKFKAGDSIFGLPKQRNILLKAKPKPKKETEEAVAPGAVPAAPGAAPAAATAAGAVDTKAAAGKEKAAGAKEKPAKK